LLIPNADRAVIEAAKLHDYLLSRTHPVGRFKAAFFHALGYSADNWRQLETTGDNSRQTFVASTSPRRRPPRNRLAIGKNT
jgi:hypothetical protein